MAAASREKLKKEEMIDLNAITAKLALDGKSGHHFRTLMPK